MTVLLGVLLAWFVSAAQAACDRRVDVAAWAGHLADAERAYAALDVDAYGRAMDEAVIELPCLAGPVDPALAARWHRLQGLRLFLAKQRPRAVAAFGAARALDPGYTFAEDLVPAGHPIRVDYGAMDLASLRNERVGEPLSGELRFDGMPGVLRPADRPTVVQVLGPDGVVASTAWIEPADPMPAYVARPPPRARRVDPRVAVGAGTGAAAIGAGVLYVAGARDAERFAAYDAFRSQGELDALRAQANGQVVASAALGVLAIAGAATLVVVW